tara:strand:- start:160 stop:576 length:417 start_codon:yes stop_codon:yes gene_type:complete
MRYWSKELWYGMVTLLSLLLVCMLVTLVHLYQEQQSELKVQLKRVNTLQAELDFQKRKRAKKFDSLLADKRHVKRLLFTNQRTIDDLEEQRSRLIRTNKDTKLINTINRQRTMAEKKKRQYAERMAYIEAELSTLMAQ